MPDILNPFFPEIVRGAEDGANNRGYSIILCNSDNDPEKEIKYIKLLKNKYVDGIVFCTNLFQDNKKVRSHLGTDIPIVMTDSLEAGQGQYTVTFNNEEGSYIATKHLLSLGHRKIACITGPNSTTSSAERFQGYRKALKEAGIKIDDSLIYEGDYKLNSGVEAIEKLKNKDYTAIFAFNDLMAYGVYKKLYDIGLKIPDDVSVIGYDNISFSQFIHPSLTTISQPSYQIGEKAVNILIDNVEGRKNKENRVIYQPELIIRDSTREIGGN